MLRLELLEKDQEVRCSGDQSQTLEILEKPVEWANGVIIVALLSLSHVRLSVTHGLNTPGFPVLHYLPEFAQTHVHQVCDAIQLSYPLSSPSPPALNLTQHQSFPMSQLFISGGQIIGASSSASVLPMKIQHWFPLGRTGLISLLSRGLSRVFSSTTLWKNQFFGPQPSLWSNSHIHTWLLDKPLLWLYGPSSTKVYLHSPFIMHVSLCPSCE